MKPQTQPKRSLARFEAGAVYSEYIIVVTVVSLVASAMVVGLGAPLFNYFADVAGYVVSPVP